MVVDGQLIWFALSDCGLRTGVNGDGPGSRGLPYSRVFSAGTASLWSENPIPFRTDKQANPELLRSGRKLRRFVSTDQGEERLGVFPPPRYSMPVPDRG